MALEERKQTAERRNIPAQWRKPRAPPLKQDGNERSKNESPPKIRAKRRNLIGA